MKLRSDLLDRAKMTVERTALGLRDLREELDSAAGLGSHEQHFLWDAITDLEWRHSLLSDFHLDMLLSPPHELEERWRQFSICYDDYREAARGVRSDLAQARRGDAGPRHAPPAPGVPVPPPIERG